MKVRVLTAVAALALAAGLPPSILDELGKGNPPLVDIQTYVQHINVLTS
ncbi:hypothetical protein ACGFJC_11675 [Nonomuraea fuscirosea]|uniref:Uncharacterized protein n=1 Tax=Nonomuraea fuscirosea TaxID=1291556 RepID=A0A2T0MKC3_9ACTN|nr:hypothetical protein [Nonomuraea fuscirosea]PRX58064.1 hypothetical protein B0I32_12449 [Nonomuraea fuscirosea]WSA55114.1 hypothetical protein OIE67_11040 [Nonomuraea fuscirosea]